MEQILGGRVGGCLEQLEIKAILSLSLNWNLVELRLSLAMFSSSYISEGIILTVLWIYYPALSAFLLTTQTVISRLVLEGYS